MLRFTSVALPAFLVLGVLASACTGEEGPKDQLDPRILYSFEGCDDLLGYTKEQAKALIEEYGNIHGIDYESGWLGDPAEGDGGGTGTGGSDGGDSAGDSGGDPEFPGDDEGGGGDGQDYSGTNVQEAGVDEPDIVKTDGERILALARGRLHFVDASGVSPVLRGSLD
ncbi:MAG TPA: beta-propeller domain-containing protein, partial [Nannocystis sp.]